MITTLALGIGGHEDLVDRSRSSAPPAEHVARTFHDLHKPVYLYLYTIVGNPAIAEDLTQETFLRLLREFHRGASIDNERAWLFRVATNLALSHKKSQAPVAGALAIERSGCFDENPGPEEAVLHAETRRLLSAGMARLSQQERQCLLLRSEGLRYREIADVLSIRVSTVATFITRAVRKLSESVHG